MSIPGDKWVSSKGDVLTCEQLFDALSKRDNTDTDCKMIWLSDYDFQDMYETDLTARLGWHVEEQEVPVYEPDEDIFTNRPYGELLKTGAVVYYKSRLWFFSNPSNQGILHGVWTNEDGETKNTYDFLIDLFNYTGPAVELVLDPKRFIPKEV